MDNRTVADRLKTHARQLDRLAGNPYRIKAYRRAAENIERLTIPVEDLLRQQGVAGLRQVAGIGDHLAFAIERLIATGDFHTLSGDPAEIPPRDDVRSLPGVGPHVAELLWEQLQIRTVADLERALEDHRLEQLPLGEKRRRQLCEALHQRRDEESRSAAVAGEPSVAELLEVDRDYRRLAAAEQLPTIAPKKFNPFGESWLPLHAVRRNGWKYRALFSNTALAHRLGRTRDWVVIYFSNDMHRGQRTVVTEQRGTLRGRRVVRGREAECRLLYGAEDK
jgi:hypothetical protein